MPFRKTGSGTYRSPSGRRFTAKQVRAYYATDGFKRKTRTLRKLKKRRKRGRK